MDSSELNISLWNSAPALRSATSWDRFKLYEYFKPKGTRLANGNTICAFSDLINWPEKFDELWVIPNIIRLTYNSFKFSTGSMLLAKLERVVYTKEATWNR